MKNGKNNNNLNYNQTIQKLCRKFLRKPAGWNMSGLFVIQRESCVFMGSDRSVLFD